MIRNRGTIEQFTLLLHLMQRDSAILIANEVLHHISAQRPILI